jgi:hypothetical protein
MRCSCREVKGVDVIPQWHNCEYINKRNRLIPEAEKRAILNSVNEKGQMNEILFTHLFSKYMEELVKKHGIV